MEKLFIQIGDEVREYTDAEYAQNELDKQESARIAAEQAELQAEAEAKKAAALAKLAALGLEEDDFKALGL
jgi:hypothetical protein